MDKMLKIAIFTVLFGFIFGAIFFINKMDNYILIPYNKIIYETEKANWILFFESFFSYSKYIIIIFLMIFIKYGFVISYLFLYIRSVTVGFTTFFFVINGNFSGVIEIFKIFLLQNIIFIFLLIILCVASYKLSVKNRKRNIKDILTIYIFAEIIVILICIYESFFLKIFL